jgi:hypothetical protein
MCTFAPVKQVNCAPRGVRAQKGRLGSRRQRQRRARLAQPLPYGSHPERERRGGPHAWHTARGPRSPGGWHPGTQLLRCQYLYFCTRKASKLRESKVSVMHVSAWQQTAHVSIRQHTSAYVSIRLHTSADEAAERGFDGRLHTSAYVCIRQHTSAYVSIRLPGSSGAWLLRQTV